MNKRSFEREQRECASMIGLTKKQYDNSLKHIKVAKFKKKRSNDNILAKLGLYSAYLKRKIQ